MKANLYKTRKNTFHILAVLLLVLLVIPGGQALAASKKSKALKAYKKFLSQKSVSIIPSGILLGEDGDDDNPGYGKVYSKPTASSEIKFALAYLNKDSIPELILVDNSGIASQGMAVFAWKKKKVVRLGYIQGGCGIAYAYWKPKKIGYYRKCNLQVVDEAVSEGSGRTICQLKGSGLSTLISKYRWDGEKSYFYQNKNGDEVSAKAYSSTLKKLSKGKKRTNLAFRTNSEKNRKRYLR